MWYKGYRGISLSLYNRYSVRHVRYNEFSLFRRDAQTEESIMGDGFYNTK